MKKIVFTGNLRRLAGGDTWQTLAVTIPSDDVKANNLTPNQKVMVTVEVM